MRFELIATTLALFAVQPDTVPQGVVDMNKCTDVLDAEPTTTHPNSLSIVTPERTVYIKSTSREEIQWARLLHTPRIMDVAGRGVGLTLTHPGGGCSVFWQD
ncbi:hypothetical protein RRG08_044048 [Elysia crispata]|uniref:Uncharacterized protein n=1 Tax=Elysia crispata TaxID=231223 RepID=A0AAE1CR50_9GAST|nr:hypothetical protein RRG08_044048 [Elysia crispata]